MTHACRHLRFVLGDQLSHRISSLDGLDPAVDVVLMAEVAEETTYVRHHKKKIALVLSAMRHFAAELAARGITVDYVALTDPGNTGSFGGELARAVRRHRPGRIIVTEPGEWRVRAEMERWPQAVGRPVEIRTDDRFLCTRAGFARWAQGRSSLRMELFYRGMRRRTGLMMEADGSPAGGRWNFDPENRKALPRRLAAPAPRWIEPDAVTRAVIDLVAARFADHFGDLEPFGFPVTAAEAEALFARFLTEALPGFGDYQDAMRLGAPALFHSMIAPALNIGLLDPLDLCRRVEAEWRAGRVPINAAEGFIRQIIGWREYVRGIYWLKMPGYAAGNALAATRPLPSFYWSGETTMRCIAEVVSQTRREAYAHHIQRLMVTGNFALLTGIAPAAICAWYLAVYADAYDWVELPNTLGMAIFGDGGLLASKPYAASGKYIDRMSDYCSGCSHDVAVSDGPGACPFNHLYWDFLMRNRARLGRNPRLAMPYRLLDRMAPGRRAAVAAASRAFLATLS